MANESMIIPDEFAFFNFKIVQFINFTVVGLTKLK